MTRVDLLTSLKQFTIDTIKDIILPTKQRPGDRPANPRAAEVYIMRLPDSKAAKAKAPYIIHQFITGDDVQAPGELPKSSAIVRSIFCVYSPDEQEGGLMLMELMERLRIELLRKRVIGRQFELDLEAGLGSMAYPDDTAPFYAGEMVTTWKLPAIEREVRTW